MKAFKLSKVITTITGSRKDYDVVVTAKNVRMLNGKMVSGPRVVVVNAPHQVIQIVERTTFSSKDIDRVARTAMRQHAVKPA